MELLSRPFLGIPLWGWLAIAGIGIAAAVFLLPKLFGGTSTLGSGPASNQANQPADPNIDPNTGVPYQVEQAIDPKTGLPAYFDLFNQGAGSAPPPGTAPGNQPPKVGGASPPTPGLHTGGTVTTGTTPTGTGTRVVATTDTTTGPHPTGITSPTIQVSDWGRINAYNPAARGRAGAEAAADFAAPPSPPARPGVSLPYTGWPRP